MKKLLQKFTQFWNQCAKGFILWNLGFNQTMCFFLTKGIKSFLLPTGAGGASIFLPSEVVGKSMLLPPTPPLQTPRKNWNLTMFFIVDKYLLNFNIFIFVLGLLLHFIVCPNKCSTKFCINAILWVLFCLIFG